MTTIVELPGGHSATLRDSDELSNRDVKALRRAARRVGVVGQKLKDLGLDDLRVTDEADDERDEEATNEKNQRALSILTNLSDEEDDSLDLFQRECAALRLVDWTLDLPLPKTADDVDGLPRPIYNALTTEAAKLDLNESFEKTPETQQDPKAGTPASDDSSSSSEAVSP